jgi:ubiquinone/menaquinone biosynthesis C-methylase UbiE
LESWKPLHESNSGGQAPARWIETDQSAKAKLGPTGEFVLGSILDLPLPDNHVDAVYCAHVIYHIDAAFQEKAVRELIRVTKPGGRVVIIYANPNSRCPRD